MLHGKPPDLQDALDFYHSHYFYTGSTTKDFKKRLKHFRTLIPETVRLYDEKKVGPNWDKYLLVINNIVPEDAYQWKRDEKLTPHRLSIYLTIKVGQVLTQRPDEYLGFATPIRLSRSAGPSNKRAPQISC